jgi:sugar/nucleoside kinase (ribokinase family)
MTAVQFIDTGRDGDRTIYTITGTREDGSTYPWHSDENPAKVIATAQLYARYHRKKVAELLAEADALERAADGLRCDIGPDALREQTRAAVLARLDWAEWFFGRGHTRNDVWPADKQERLTEVRGIVTACASLGRLEEWALICEAPDRDWAETLMRQTAVQP